MRDRMQQKTSLVYHPGLYPKNMYINRGNHEAKEMNRTYGFEGEAKHKFGEQTYKVRSPEIPPGVIQLFAHNEMS